MTEDVILGIESAIGGGSLAISAGGNTLGTWQGSDGPARSEELLLHISELINTSGILPGELTKVAVSNGPGSYTGIRIGLATALGLANAYNLPCVGISVLNSIARNAAANSDLVVIVPVGRQNFCWQTFLMSESTLSPGKLVSGSLADFGAQAGEFPAHEIFAHSDVYDQLMNIEDEEFGGTRLVDIGRILAIAVARDARRIDEGLEPLYVRETKFSLQAGGKGGHS